MKVLNLVNAASGEIQYKISKFPDGQQNIVLIDLGHDFFIHSPVVQIISRLNNWLDLELITCAVACLRKARVKEIHLKVPYIVGGRSDRFFETGGNNYIKDVIAPVINLLDFESVLALDPHSDVLEACIKKFTPISNIEFVENVLNTMFPERWDNPSIALDNIVLIAPDSGAVKKIYKIADAIGYRDEIIVCSKHRDVDGKLTKTVVPLKTEHSNTQLLIIDDICDGGATFINIAKEIKSYGKRLVGQGGCWHSKLHLAVTHGIFSKGFEELVKCFDSIYCTNSYKEIIPPKGNYDVDNPTHYPDWKYGGSGEPFCKQFNVF